jgi:hypothetical protein
MEDKGLGWLAPDEIEPFLLGLGLMGTGGGGALAFGREIMRNDLAQGRRYHVVSPEEVPDDALVVSGGIMGSVKALERFSIPEIVARWEKRFEPLLALRAMEETLGRKVDFLVPFELGGLNTPVILSLGARAGIPVVDGDGLGRAAPETQMTSFAGHGVSIVPMPLVDSEGNLIVVKESVTPFFPDEVGRFVVTRAGGMGANSHYPMDGRTFRGAVVPETISLALELGKKVVALDGGQAVAEAVARELGGRTAFHGTVRELQEKEALGFFVQTALIEGEDDFRGSELEITIKNEYMMAVRDGEVGCIFPDLIVVVGEDGGPVMSVDLRPGLRVWVVVAPCAPRLREAALSPVGREALGPARFGHPELEYRPVEELSRAWGLEW